MASQEELIAQFIDISGSEENVAKFYLSSANWRLEEAISTYLSTQNDDGEQDVTPPLRPIPSDLDVLPQSELQRSAAAAAAASKGNNDNAKFEKSSSGARKVATLFNLPKESNSSDEEEGQAFYAGGSERSGQQVLGPPKRKNFREQLTEMFRMAQEHNHPDVVATPSTSGASSSAQSWGQGVRLGMTESDHAVVAPRRDSASGGSEQRPVVVLRLWSQGFSVDDGELRSYDDPENKDFLETVMRGEIPLELLKMGWQVNVDVEDHRHEDYKKKPTVVKTFKGSGHTLGSPAPNVTVETEVTNTVNAAAAAIGSNASESSASTTSAQEAIHVNPAEPVTTLQIRLSDGSRISAQFNLTHTIADIHQYIQNARPQYANSVFTLVSSFPTRELTDPSVTIDAAGLKNAALMQRLK